MVVLFWPLCGLAATTNVNIVDFAFQPADVTINVGDTVTWTNMGTLMHTSTSGTTTGGTPHPDGLWDSGPLSPGDSFSHTFATAGTFPYYCTPHFTIMTGMVTVTGAANVPPTVSIVSPADGATFVFPTQVMIEAMAADSDGTVTQVEFFDDSDSLGVDASAPYYVMVALSLGVHVLTAVATDNANNTTTSGAVTVTVGTEGIQIPLRSPSSRAISGSTWSSSSRG